jgi:hypothetical protein
MTEEDIKAKILLPYLHDLGIDVSEISLEDSFKIRLGKTKQATGRSDILCKRHRKNLFVIELKNDSIEITQDDIDQGISYARLLPDDIAPFTIISNGRTAKIFDSITRKELTENISSQSSFWINGYTLSADEDMRIRYEALKNFISLSPKNLKTFCTAQVYNRMGSIIGDINSPYSKFVKELFIQREELQIAFERFLNSNDSIFGLIGNAGVGKTSAICSLSLQHLEDAFVFFYNAAIIDSPVESIAQDLNLVFSSTIETNNTLKRLNELGRFANKNILIFVDAIDENTNQKITQELSDLAYAATSLDYLKIIISCKSNILNSILKISDNPTHLYDELKKSHQTLSDLDNNPGFLLKEFSDKELKDILPLYQKAFGFKGTISELILRELKNGFFLKLFCEVYSGKQVPNKINDKELIQKYLKQSLAKTRIDYVPGLRFLAAIGKIIIDHEYTSWQTYKDEGIDVNQILEKLNLSLDENIPEDLFTRNILIKSNTEESYNISFYYSKIRDYIICFHSYQLDKMSDSDFYDVLCDFYKNHIGESAIDFYLENATPSHLNTLIQFKKDKALSYAENYNLYLENNFKKFKNKFDPYTDGDIGIVLHKNLTRRDSYGLFPLKSEQTDKVLHEDLSFDGPYETNAILQLGVQTIYGSNTLLFNKDQNSVVKKNVFKQLKKIIEKGGFTAYNSEVLLLEEVSVILYFYYKKLYFNEKIEEYYLPRFKDIYPIDLKDLQQRINRFRLNEFYKYEKMEHAVREEIIEKALKDGIDGPRIRGMGDVAPFEELYKATEILIAKGYDQIHEHYLPLPDKSIVETKAFYDINRRDNWPLIRLCQFSESQAKLYITEFFRKFELSYKEFVEYCFPNFKNDFPFYCSIPHEYFHYTKNANVLDWGMLGYRPSKTGKFEIYFEQAEPAWDLLKKENLNILMTFSLDRILRVNDHARYPVKTVDKLNTSKVDEYCVIRNWIYQFLEDDMKNLFKANED